MILEQAPRISNDRYLAFPNGFRNVHDSRQNIKEAQSLPRGLSNGTQDEARGTVPTTRG